MKLSVINTGYFKLDGGAMFGVVPKSIWQRNYPADENNLCTWAMRCLLIEEGDKKILIDTGIGDKQDAKFFSHYYLHGADSLDKSLSDLGLSVTDITDVILTHLHFDHVGGAVVNEKGNLLPKFPKATYWTNEKHLETATSPNEREKASFLEENILPLEITGQLGIIEEGTSPFSFIDFYWVNGHTAAQMLPIITCGDKQIAYCADLFPSVGHIPIPYVMAYDTQPLLTLKEKEQFLRQAFEQDYVLFFEHDPLIECCTLQKTEKGMRVKDTFLLSEVI